MDRSSRAPSASQSWRSFRCATSRSLSTTPRAGSCERRYRAARRTRDASRYLQHHPERSRALLELVRRCLHAPHAAPHLVGHRAPRWPSAGISGVAWLHPDALRLCRAAVRRDQAWHAGDCGARRRGARRDRSSGFVPAEGRCRRPRRRRGRRSERGGQQGRSGETCRHDRLPRSRARDGVGAHKAEIGSSKQRRSWLPPSGRLLPQDRLRQRSRLRTPRQKRPRRPTNSRLN